MKEINLEKIRASWKNNPAFSEAGLSPEIIAQYRSKTSRETTKLFRSGLVTDITLKAVLMVSFVVLMILYLHQPMTMIIIAVGGIVTLSGLVYQLRTLGRVPGNRPEEMTIRQSLESKVDYYNRWHVRSLMVAALTNAMLIISGMLFYFLFEYGEVRPLALDDFIVLGAIPVVGFALGAFIQLKHHSFHMGQIETVLDDFDAEQLNAAGFLRYRQKRKRIIAIYFLAFLAGLLIFLYVAFK